MKLVYLLYIISGSFKWNQINSKDRRQKPN